MVFFGIGGFVYAIAFSAAAAYDARKKVDFSASTEVANLFTRLVTFPFICGVGWPSLVVILLGYKFYALHLVRRERYDRIAEL